MNCANMTFEAFFSLKMEEMTNIGIKFVDLSKTTTIVQPDVQFQLVEMYMLALKLTKLASKTLLAYNEMHSLADPNVPCWSTNNSTASTIAEAHGGLPLVDLLQSKTNEIIDEDNSGGALSYFETCAAMEFDDVMEPGKKNEEAEREAGCRSIENYGTDVDCNEYMDKLHNMNQQGMNSDTPTLKCTHCNDSFREREKLATHLLTHCENLFLCPQCPYVSTSEETCRSHTVLCVPTVSLKEKNEINRVESTKTAVPKTPECPISKPSETTNGFTNVSSYANTDIDTSAEMINQSKGEIINEDQSSLKPSGTCVKREEKARVLSYVVKINRLGKRYFQCVRCKSKCSSRQIIKRHMMIHDNIRPFSCCQCNRSFHQKWHMTRHVVSHLDKSFSCPLCSYSAKKEESLKVHYISKHSENKVYECNLCTYTAHSQWELNFHRHQHKTRKYTLYCELCGCSVFSMKEFKNHKHGNTVKVVGPGSVLSGSEIEANDCVAKNVSTRIGATSTSLSSKNLPDWKVSGDQLLCQEMEGKGSKSYHFIASKTPSGKVLLKCMLCEKKYRQLRRIKDHMKIHDTHRPFSCCLCGRSFSRKDHMKNHIITHLKYPSFPCPHCSFSTKVEFKLKFHLQKHMFYPCSFCSYIANTKSRLNHHNKSHKARNCSQCNFVCYSYQDLQSHHSKNHPNFSCFKCEFQASNHTELKNHEESRHKKHVYCCEICGYSTDMKKCFVYHKKRHEDRTPLHCPDCDYKCSSHTSYRGHRAKHTGVKSHLCTYCGATFSSSSHLKKHLQIHENKKPFKCSFCDYQCRGSHNMRMHELTHFKKKPFACKLCSYSCCRKKALETHNLKHHSSSLPLEGSAS